MAWAELSARYNRAVMGAAWNALAFGSFCLIIITLFGSLQPGLEFEYGPYVVVGFLIYSLISSLLNDAALVYITNQNWMQGVRAPYGFYIYKGLMRSIFVFLFNFVAAIGILFFYYDFDPSSSQILILAALPIYLVNGIACNVILGALCVRFRDLAQLLQTIVRFSLFITPIMWTAERGGVRGTFAQWNPLTHFIEIVRQPVLLGTVPYCSWSIVILITTLLIVSSIPVYAYTRRRLIYWL